MSSEKVAEGNESIRQAEKALKTSFLKWRPEYELAAAEYSKAATCFKAAKALPQCKDALLQASDCCVKQGSFFSAGKHLEQAAMVSRDMGDLPATISLFDKASRLLIDSRSPDTAALVLERGAKIIESKYPEKAIEFYSRASEIVSVEDRPRQAAEFCGQAVRILLKIKRLDEAADMIKRQKQYLVEGEDSPSAGRLVVALIMVNLARDDYVAADKALKEGGCYLEREELATMTQLLEGFDEGDPELMCHALNHPFVKHMETEFAKLARQLQQQCSISKQPVAKPQKEQEEVEASPAKSSAPSQGVSESGVGADGGGDKDEEDEYAGGLL